MNLISCPPPLTWTFLFPSIHPFFSPNPLCCSLGGKHQPVRDSQDIISWTTSPTPQHPRTVETQIVDKKWHWSHLSMPLRSEWHISKICWLSGCKHEMIIWDGKSVMAATVSPYKEFFTDDTQWSVVFLTSHTGGHVIGEAISESFSFVAFFLSGVTPDWKTFPREPHKWTKAVSSLQVSRPVITRSLIWIPGTCHHSLPLCLNNHVNLNRSQSEYASVFLPGM